MWIALAEVKKKTLKASETYTSSKQNRNMSIYLIQSILSKMC